VPKTRRSSAVDSLDIAMDDALLMGVPDGFAHRNEEFDPRPYRQPLESQ